MSEEILVENYSVGLSDWIECNIPSDTPPRQATEMLQRYAAEHDYPMPDARGVPLSSAFDELVNWFRNRRLVADEGVQRASYRWFSFHVPPKGKGSISWSRSEEQSAGMTLKVFGAGWGGSAAIKLSKTIELNDCTSCHDIIQHLEVRVRRYVIESPHGTPVEETTIDPVRWLHREPRECENCCGQQIDRLDPFKFELLESDAVDARKTSARLKIDRELELAFATELSLKLELPGRVLEAGLEGKSAGALRYKSEWEFAPGALYMPYVRLHQRGIPPKWGVC